MMNIEYFINKKLPVKLKGSLKETIENAYENAINEIGPEEIRYIHEKVARKFETTISSRTSWVAEMTKCYKAIYDLLGYYKNNSNDILSNTIKSIGAALFYYINPYDVIPDFTPGTGYMDDFYVMVLCLKKIKSNNDDVEILNRFLKKYKLS